MLNVYAKNANLVGGTVQQIVFCIEDKRRTTMKLKYTVGLFLFCLFAGCGTITNLAESSISDISGWDFSACVGRNEFETCTQLFLDNQELILNLPNLQGE